MRFGLVTRSGCMGRTGRRESSENAIGCATVCRDGAENVKAIKANMFNVQAKTRDAAVML